MASPTSPSSLPQSAGHDDQNPDSARILPRLTSPLFTDWPTMRQDLLSWIMLSDLTAVVLPVWVALISLSWGVSRLALTALAGILMVSLTWASGALGVDVVDQARSGSERVALAALVTAPVTLLLGQLLAPALSAGAVLAPLAAQFALAVVGRTIESNWLRARRMEGHGLRRTLIVMGPGAEPILRDLRSHPGDGFLIVGYVSSSTNRSRTAARLGDQDAINAMIRSEHIDVVMTLGGVGPEDLVTLMRGLTSTGARLVVAPGLQDVVPGRMRGLPVTHGWTGLIDVSLRRTRLLAKEVFDRIAGSLLLLIASPILAGAALAVRLDSPGPAFYTQTRVGAGGKHFTLWKLRSMYTDADARRAAVVSAGGDVGNEVLFKNRTDPRITRVGRFIRRTSIDELPQLINVVRGEMSLVGPRPALPSEVAEYDAEARRRLLVKPGLTGLWQVSGRSDLSWDSTVALDRHYVENRGARLDASIFLSTFKAVVGGKGAY
ncbi:sugar transferase [Actinomyces succiniciruminis]|uniref:Undecaprenyl-phosphate galactose phosphotransferase n=1 Tax=Actinomyces succiniciruminis TaxID=1522002 RepID=A0A1L7RQG7_9ACTO|nr:sugar transferase [Actinomyces succiniciruminis]CED92510.1 Undecaprenyl-phosphate galactose phosphotransferase [Actinomyces succiniciruminis]